MRPAYRTGSSSEALGAARRTQVNRGLGLVLGAFLLYGLTFFFAPGLLSVEVSGAFRVGELAAFTQVLVVAAGVLRHDRHARRHVEPLASRVVTREPAPHAAEFHSAAAVAPAGAAHSEDGGGFNAFDSSRAFGGRRTGRAAGATT